jgi:hypothetical protein
MTSEEAVMRRRTGFTGRRSLGEEAVGTIARADEGARQHSNVREAALVATSALARAAKS